jgi:hypothetical protein
MKVVIVGKTRMFGGQWCMGALRLRDWTSLRLLPIGNAHAWPAESDVDVGEVYEVDGARPNQLTLPHIEDFRLTKFVYEDVYDGDLPSDIVEHVKVARRGRTPLFQDCLKRVQSSSLAVLHANVPSFSTQFWVADRDLPLVVKWEKNYYGLGNFHVRYVGSQDVLQVIPAGSLVRLSLARWWGPEDQEQGCYLQLSGWWLPPPIGTW